MGFKDIVVHVDSTIASTTRVWVSLALARRWSARVIGLHVIPNLPTPPHFTPSHAERISSLYRESAREAAIMAESQFRKDIKDADVETQWRSVEGDIARGLAEHGRFADLLIVGQGDTENPPMLEPFLLPQKVVMESGIPVLVIPTAPIKAFSIGQRILVSWDGSREAAQPFMTRYHCSGKQVRFGFWPSIPIGKFTLAQAPILPAWRRTSKDTVSPPK
jgi:hypothetical protein